METRRLLPEVHSDRPIGNRPMLKPWASIKLPSDLRKSFFNIQVVKYGNRDLGTVDSPSTPIECLHPWRYSVHRDLIGPVLSGVGLDC